MEGKKMKLAAIALVIVALVAMMIPITAVAAPPQSGTLNIHKYSMTDASKATSPGTGDASDEANVPADAVPLEGVTFKVYSVVIDSSTENGQGVYPAPGAITPDSLTNPTKITDSKGQVFSITAVAAPHAALSSTGITTDADGLATTGDIPQGIYLVLEQDASSLGVTAPASPFVVAVPMAKADGTGWINPVNVYPKNEMLTLKKTVDKPSVSVGDTINWTIDAALPSGLDNIKSYTITDQLDSALDCTGVSLLATDTVTGLPVVIPAANYTLTPTTFPAASGALVKVVFNQTGIDWFAANNVKSVRVVIATKVNESVATEINVPNQANASFTNKSDETTDLDPSNETDIHTGTLEITKIDPAIIDNPDQPGDLGAKRLEGAIFKIALTSADAKAGDFLRVDADGNIIKPGDANYATATDITITTGADGTGSFTGLADLMNDTAATYWVSETKAPAGYNILVNPVQVVFNAATKANDWTAEITVRDSKGFTLPLTGAAGVAIFTIAGIVLVGLAVMLTINLKKKKAETQA